jgi:glycosyltransferase involved in cell wall biosynthesis
MNVVMLNWRDNRHPLAGGAEVVVDHQCRGLGQLGHTVTLLTSKYPNADSETQLEYYRVIRTGGKYSSFPGVLLALREIWCELRPDVVIEHIHGVPWFSPLWSQAPSVGCLYHRVGRVFFKELPYPLALAGYVTEMLLPQIYKDHLMVCLGQAASTEFRMLGFHSDQLVELNPGVDHTMYKPDSRRRTDPIFVVPGPIKHYKRPDIAILAFGQIHGEFPDAKLVLIGRPRTGMESKLLELVDSLGLSHSVYFPGFIPESTKVELFQRAMALVYCSEAEGWGLATLEAAACGTPSIVPESTGLRDAVSPGRTGLSYKPLDAQGLAQQMRTILFNPELREYLGSNALSASAQFTWERYSRSFERIVRTVAERSYPSSGIGTVP